MSFKHLVKIELLLAVVVFAYVLCLSEGIRQRKQIRVKRFRSGLTGPAQSIFKLGLQELSALLIDFERFLKRVKGWFDSRSKVKWHFVQ